MEQKDLADVERMAKVVKLFRLVSEGKSEVEIRKEMGLEEAEYNRFRKECFEKEAERIKEKGIGEVYVEYMLHQKKCLEDLEAMSKQFSNAKHYSALVTSVKTRSDIYDKIIKVGQEFGLLEKRPERREIVAGVLVAKMNSNQLRSTILGELQGMEKLMNTFGGLGLEEIEPGELYPALPPATEIIDMTTKPLPGHKSRAHVLSSGRRVVKKVRGEG